MSKRIIGMDKHGNMKVYASIADAAKQLQLKETSVKHVVHGYRGSLFGYTFCWYDKYVDQREQRVASIDPKTNKVVREFDTVKCALKHMKKSGIKDGNTNNLSYQLNNENAVRFGYKWRRI